MTVLEVENLKKIYRPRFGGNQVQALSKVTFSVEEGEYVAIMGESGSGKTTLLNMLAALDKPTEGEVYLDGKPLSAIREKDLSNPEHADSDLLDFLRRLCLIYIIAVFLRFISALFTAVYQVYSERARYAVHPHWKS